MEKSGSKMHDISAPISNKLPVWPGDPSVSIIQRKAFSTGDHCNVTEIHMGTHAGTHIDAPLHFIEGGAAVDAIPIDICIGPCLVIELDSKDVISREDLRKNRLSGHSRVLLKTRNSELWANDNSFHMNYVALGLSAAQYLIETGVVLVGIDYLSIEAYQSPGSRVHTLLLQNNIVVVEGLNLSSVKPGEYELICAPIRLMGAEAAPARVFLREA